jgi:hypothetical protein
MPKTTREIAESLRTDIPPPRARTGKPVGSWRGLKPTNKLNRLADEEPRVWTVSAVSREGATVQAGDGAFGLINDPEWRKHWKRVRATRVRKPKPTTKENPK